MSKYTLEKLEQDITEIINDLSALRAAKGHDYSGSADTLDNLREFGSHGVLVRIGDKFKRLKHFYQQGVLQVADEKITDTMDDLINYALYLKIMYGQETAANNKTLRCYFARAVRGANGDAASVAEVKANIQAALQEVASLRETVADLEIYCPHEHEDHYQQAWRQGLFSSADVLNQCLAIVRLCEVVLVASDPASSAGVAVEIEEARKYELPVLHLWCHPPEKWPDLINAYKESIH